MKSQVITFLFIAEYEPRPIMLLDAPKFEVFSLHVKTWHDDNHARIVAGSRAILGRDRKVGTLDRDVIRISRDCDEAPRLSVNTKERLYSSHAVVFNARNKTLGHRE